MVLTHAWTKHLCNSWSIFTKLLWNDSYSRRVFPCICAIIWFRPDEFFVQIRVESLMQYHQKTHHWHTSILDPKKQWTFAADWADPCMYSNFYPKELMAWWFLDVSSTKKQAVRPLKSEPGMHKTQNGLSTEKSNLVFFWFGRIWINLSSYLLRISISYNIYIYI